MKYTHVKRDIENNISFPKEAYYYITKWERKNGEITIEDYRDSQCHGQIIVTAPENGQSITKVFTRSSAMKNWILDLVGAPVKTIQPGGTGGWF